VGKKSFIKRIFGGKVKKVREVDAKAFILDDPSILLQKLKDEPPILEPKLNDHPKISDLYPKNEPQT
jgi:hypothetical protein